MLLTIGLLEYPGKHPTPEMEKLKPLNSNTNRSSARINDQRWIKPSLKKDGQEKLKQRNYEYGTRVWSGGGGPAQERYKLRILKDETKRAYVNPTYPTIPDGQEKGNQHAKTRKFPRTQTKATNLVSQIVSRQKVKTPPLNASH